MKQTLCCYQPTTATATSAIFNNCNLNFVADTNTINSRLNSMSTCALSTNTGIAATLVGKVDNKSSQSVDNKATGVSFDLMLIVFLVIAGIVLLGGGVLTKIMWAPFSAMKAGAKSLAAAKIYKVLLILALVLVVVGTILAAVYGAIQENTGLVKNTPLFLCKSTVMANYKQCTFKEAKDSYDSNKNQGLDFTVKGKKDSLEETDSGLAAFYDHVEVDDECEEYMENDTTFSMSRPVKLPGLLYGGIACISVGLLIFIAMLIVYLKNKNKKTDFIEMVNTPELPGSEEQKREEVKEVAEAAAQEEGPP